jgi:hypothetical protein
MTKDEKLAILTEWQAQIERANAGFDPLREALGYGESKPEMAFAFLQDAYTRAIAKLVGDQDGHLAWYSLENDFGRKAEPAGKFGAERPIASFEDLLWLIEVTA